MAFEVTLSRIQTAQLCKSEDTIQVPIKFQVKGGTITWYFISPLDATRQEFRDELYQSAALGHLKVDGHCEKYWRGTNSLHVKKMHTKLEEAETNHNHYRLENDRDYSPITVTQHLFGLVEAQQEMGLFEDKTKIEKFLSLEEALEISHQYNLFWTEMNHVGAAHVAKVGAKTLHLPARKESLMSRYKQLPEHTFTPEDIAEWEANRDKEEPCRAISPLSPLQERLQGVKAGMRGIGSELAHTRQYFKPIQASAAAV